MRISIEVDRKLLSEAKEIGKFKTQKETLEEALKEFIKYRKRLDLIELFGTIDYDPDYDYKKLRERPDHDHLS